MKINTKAFGEIEISDDKIITFPKGIIGFPNLQHFTLLHDAERGNGAGIRFLQSIEEPAFAMPVMDPLVVKPDYDPEVEDDFLTPIGELTQENILVLVTVTIPSDLKQMSVNLQAPLVINVDERKACQMIVDAEKCPLKFPIYEILQARKGEA